MCRTAPGLKEHKPQEGDLYALPNGVVFVVASYCFRVDDAHHRIYLAIPPTMRPSQIEGEPDFESPMLKKQDYELHPIKYWTWLPSQAQLQKMLIDANKYDTNSLLSNFNHWLKVINFNSEYPLQAMEELWLVFVWETLYHEVWNLQRQRWFKTNLIA